MNSDKLCKENHIWVQKAVVDSHGGQSMRGRGGFFQTAADVGMLQYVKIVSWVMG